MFNSFLFGFLGNHSGDHAHGDEGFAAKRRIDPVPGPNQRRKREEIENTAQFLVICHIDFL